MTPRGFDDTLVITMPRRRTKRDEDENEIATRVLAEAIGETSSTPPPEEEAPKNPAAVALGKLGGKKGGAARAAKLTARERAESAKKAARARWGS